MNNPQGISEVIQSLADRKAISVHRMLEECGLKKSAVDTMKIGKVPAVYTVAAIANYFNVSTDFLLENESNFTKLNISPDERKLLSNYRLLSGQGQDYIQLTTDMALQSYKNPDTKTQVDIAAVACDEPDQSVQSISKPSRANVVPITKKSKLRRKKTMKVIDLYASAGLGQFLVVDVPVEKMTFDESEVDPHADFGVRISGDSMEPLIHDEEIVWVKEQSAVDSEQIGIFIVNNEAYCKKYIVDHEKKKAFLQSLNPAYGPIEFDENYDVKTIGLVLI